MKLALASMLLAMAVADLAGAGRRRSRLTAARRIYMTSMVDAASLVLVPGCAGTRIGGWQSQAESIVSDQGPAVETGTETTTRPDGTRVVHEYERREAGQTVERHSGEVARDAITGGDVESGVTEPSSIGLPGGTMVRGAASSVSASLGAGGVNVFHGGAVVFLVAAGGMAYLRRWRIAAIAGLLAVGSLGLSFLAGAGAWLWLPVIAMFGVAAAAWWYSEWRRSRSESEAGLLRRAVQALRNAAEGDADTAQAVRERMAGADDEVKREAGVDGTR